MQIFKIGTIVQSAKSILQNHYMIVNSEGIIADITPQISNNSNNIIDLSDSTAVCGFINAHTHAAMINLKGLADDVPLQQWLNEYIFPEEKALINKDFVYQGTLAACREIVRGGTVHINDMYYYPKQVKRACDFVGIGSTIGITIFNKADLKMAVDIISKYKLKGVPVPFNLAPHAPYTVSDTIFKSIKDVSKDLQVSIQCHVSETHQEVKDSKKLFKKTPVERLNDLGLFDNTNFLAIHCVHVTDNDIKILSDKNVSVVHCPVSNAKLSSGLMPYAKMHAAGINVSIGTDGSASNNSLNLLQDAKFAALLHKCHAAADTLPAADVFDMLTINGAKALNLSDTSGTLEVGKQASFFTLKSNSINSKNLISHIIYGMGIESIKSVYVKGVKLFTHNLEK